MRVARLQRGSGKEFVCRNHKVVAFQNDRSQPRIASSGVFLACGPVGGVLRCDDNPLGVAARDPAASLQDAERLANHRFVLTNDLSRPRWKQATLARPPASVSGDRTKLLANLSTWWPSWRVNEKILTPPISQPQLLRTSSAVPAPCHQRRIRERDYVVQHSGRSRVIGWSGSPAY